MNPELCIWCKRQFKEHDDIQFRLCCRNLSVHIQNQIDRINRPEIQALIKKYTSGEKNHE